MTLPPTTKETATSTTDHPLLAALDVGQTVRVLPDHPAYDPFLADVDDTSISADGAIVSHGLTVVEQGWTGGVWDIATQYDPRDGWGDLEAEKRVYSGDGPTTWNAIGTVTVEAVDPGIDPDALDPGVTVEMVSTDRYRVVIPPWERKYDQKALAYNLDSASNVCERIDPSEVIRRVE